MSRLSDHAWFWVRIGFAVFLIAASPVIFTVTMWWWIVGHKTQCSTVVPDTPANSLPSQGE